MNNHSHPLHELTVATSIAILRIARNSAQTTEDQILENIQDILHLHTTVINFYPAPRLGITLTLHPTPVEPNH